MNKITVYSYDPVYLVYLGTETAYEDPLEKGSYMLPAYTTTVKPPDVIIRPNRCLVWINQQWSVEQIDNYEDSDKEDSKNKDNEDSRQIEILKHSDKEDSNHQENDHHDIDEKINNEREKIKESFSIELSVPEKIAPHCRRKQKIKFENDDESEEMDVHPDQLWDKIRKQRNQKLKKTDYLILDDYPLSPAMKDKWRKYRQALRDIPQKTKIPNYVVWPEKPF